MAEETLKDKKIKIHNFPNRESYNYDVKDVAEAVKKLKEDIIEEVAFDGVMERDRVLCLIDKIFGGME